MVHIYFGRHLIVRPAGKEIWCRGLCPCPLPRGRRLTGWYMDPQLLYIPRWVTAEDLRLALFYLEFWESQSVWSHLTVNFMLKNRAVVLGSSMLWSEGQARSDLHASSSPSAFNTRCVKLCRTRAPMNHYVCSCFTIYISCLPLAVSAFLKKQGTQIRDILWHMPVLSTSVERIFFLIDGINRCYQVIGNIFSLFVIIRTKLRP